VMDVVGGTAEAGDPAMDGMSLFDQGPLRSRMVTEGPQQFGVPSWAALRTTPASSEYYHFIEYYNIGYREYYDLRTDPYELQNLYGADGAYGTADDLPGAPAPWRLSAQLTHDRQCAGTTCPPFFDSVPPRGWDVDAQDDDTTDVGKPDDLDRVVYRFDKPIEPSSLVSGWDGTGTRAVSVRIDGDAGAGGNDVLRLPAVPELGTVDLGRDDYVTGSGVDFLSSTLALSPNFKTVTVTLGGGSAAGTGAAGGGTMSWTTSTAVHDLFGNPVVADTVIEPEGADTDF
jgi:hypothetical protein